jgi:hypothetical protein
LLTRHAAHAAVEQRKVIDFIGTSKSDGHVILTISDHLPFGGNETRLTALQDKLSDYLAFIESGGDLRRRNRKAMAVPVEISICFKHAPDERGIAFLHAAMQGDSRCGILFSLSNNRWCTGTRLTQRCTGPY